MNVEALEKLETEGVKVFPKPSVLRTIKNKILQKEYYRLHQIPTADFIITNSLSELKQAEDFYQRSIRLVKVVMMVKEFNY